MRSLDRQDWRAELRRRLRTLTPDSRPRWGRMTAHQMVCHLADACRMALGEKPVTPRRGWIPPLVVKWIALYLPLAWPAGIPTLPELDQECAGTRPADFDADLASAETLLESLATRAPDAAWPAHPIFGRMSHADWLRWGYLHTAHHLRQFGA